MEIMREWKKLNYFSQRKRKPGQVNYDRQSYFFFLHIPVECGNCINIMLCYYHVILTVRPRRLIGGLMARHFGGSCDEIMSLALPSMVSIIRIGYGTLHINIIILETPHTKYNISNSVHVPPHA